MLYLLDLARFVCASLQSNCLILAAKCQYLPAKSRLESKPSHSGVRFLFSSENTHKHRLFSAYIDDVIYRSAAGYSLRSIARFGLRESRLGGKGTGFSGMAAGPYEAAGAPGTGARYAPQFRHRIVT